MSYEKFGLSENPFLSSKADYPVIDRVEVMAELGRIVGRYVEADGPALIALLGDYGIGKTAVLQNIISHVGAGTFLPESPRPLRVAYMKALPPDSTSKYALYVLRSVVKGLGLGTFLSWKEKAEADSGTPMVMPPALAQAGTDIAKAIHALRTTTRPGRAWAYLQAEKLSVSDLSALSLGHSVDTNERAQSALIGMLKLSKRMGESGVLLLIDEWEYLFTATSSAKAVQIHTAIKDIYDRQREAQNTGAEIAPFIVLIACTPLAWERNIPRYLKAVNAPGIEPFAQRIGAEYRLKPLDRKDTTKLIASRLRARRIGGVANPLLPFTDEAIQQVYQLSQGAPRKVLDECAYLLEQCLIEQRDKIDEDFAKDKLASFEFPLSPSRGDDRP